MDEKNKMIIYMSFPKVIYFCNKTFYRMKEHANYWKILNPDYEIQLYDNEMCEKFLLDEYGELHKDIFNFLQHGPIKADFWRICILYKYGGVYSDIDNEPLIPIQNFLEPDVDFVTCSSYWDGMKFKFNPIFIISHKNNVILEKCIEWYIRKYKNKDSYDYWGWSIMRSFTDTLHLNDYNTTDGIYYLDNMKIQILRDCRGTHPYDAHSIYNNQRVFNDKYKSWDKINHCFK